MQAIVTKYLSATNTRGTRIKAYCQAGSITLGWDHALNHAGNERSAAEALCAKFGWGCDLVAGSLPDGEAVFIQVPKAKA